MRVEAYPQLVPVIKVLHLAGLEHLQLTFESREVITWPISYHEGEVSYHDPLSRGWSTRED